MTVLDNELLFSVVNNGQSDKFVEIARECGVSGATVLPAKGTATNSILRRLGLGDVSKEIVLIVLDEKTAQKVLKQAKGLVEGISALIGTGDDNMQDSWKLITVIVNSGYADDIMEIARQAGATGGTVSKARGTAVPGHEEHFLGLNIVPEKEMIMILSENEKTETIIKAIKSMECLQTPGVGIVFSQDVKQFVNLGAKK